MPSQAPNNLIVKHIDFGNAKIEYITAAQASFTAAAASTKWRQFGLTQGESSFQVQKESTEIRSGFPSQIVATFFTEENISLALNLAEFGPDIVNLCLGGPTMTKTVGTTPATTLTTGSTKTVLNLTSATGFDPLDQVEVTTAGVKQYGTIKTIVGNVVTLYEGLSGDTTPVTADAVKKVTKVQYDMGDLAAPIDMALKITKTHVQAGHTLEIYIPKAQAQVDIPLKWQEGKDPIILPVTFKAVSDSAVESGKTARLIYTMAA